MRGILKKVFSFKAALLVLLFLILLQLMKINGSLNKVNTILAIGFDNVVREVDRVYRELP